MTLDRERLTFNTTGKVRRTTLRGRKYVVAPAVMMTEGVHNGSKGPVYYSQEFLARNPHAWDHKPIVLGHPELNGNHISACNPDVLEVRGLGFVLNTKFNNGKLKTECWFDEEDTKKRDERILTALDAGQKVEVSTGEFLGLNKESGEWNGEKYSYQAKSSTPDHFAILTDVKGACSIEDGGGLLANSEKNLVKNEMSFDEIRREIVSQLYDRFRQPGYSWNGYVEEVYDGYLIYCTYENGDHKLYKMTYTVNGDEVELTGDPVEVNRIVSYRVANDGTHIADASGWTFTLPGSTDMAFDKKAYIDSLIANKVFDEKDRPELEKQSDSFLQKIKIPEPPKETVQNKEKEPDKTLVNNSDKTPTPTSAPVPTPPNPETGKMTWDDLVKNANPQTQEMLAELTGNYNETRNQLIDAIVANKDCGFTKEELGAFKMDVLRKMYKGLASKQPAQSAVPTPNFLGIQGVPTQPVANSAGAGGSLKLPKLDLGTKN